MVSSIVFCVPPVPRALAAWNGVSCIGVCMELVRGATMRFYMLVTMKLACNVGKYVRCMELVWYVQPGAAHLGA